MIISGREARAAPFGVLAGFGSGVQLKHANSNTRREADMHQDQSFLNLKPSGGTRRAHRAARAFGACLAAIALTGSALAGSASAATPPAVATGGAQAVSYQSATLTGTVNPNGSNTSYYFQFGLTKGYTSQTGIASAGAGAKTVTVRVVIAGLTPVTQYHYRLVAVDAAGVSRAGNDHTFKTTKIPLSLQILSSPNPVLFGGTVTVQGALAGTENANRKVVLEALAFPFTGTFAALPNINTQLTTATGGFTFTVPALGAATQFRVVTTTNPPIISPVATEAVAVRVTSHITKTKRHGFVRFFGTVTPAEDGAQIGILRITHGHGVLAGGTILKHHSTTSSSYSRMVRVHKGIYRVLARVVGLPVSSNYGTPLRIR